MTNGSRPPPLVAALGEFDLDPCSPVVRPWDTAKNHYSLADGDGLALPWSGRVWLNPPYGNKTFDWLKKLADHGQGVALIFARTETKGFHAEIWEKAHSIFFFKGRLVFLDVNGEPARDKSGRISCANAPSCLVSYSQSDTSAIWRAWESGTIRGRHVILQTPGGMIT